MAAECRQYVAPSKRYPQSQLNHRAESDQAWQRKGCEISPGITDQMRWNNMELCEMNINWPWSSNSSYSLAHEDSPGGPGSRGLASTIRKAMWSLTPGTMGISRGGCGWDPNDPSTGTKEKKDQAPGRKLGGASCEGTPRIFDIRADAMG